MEPRGNDPRTTERDRGEGAKTPAEQEASYDEEVADSFPASDPPSATGIIGPRRTPQGPAPKPDQASPAT